MGWVRLDNVAKAPQGKVSGTVYGKHVSKCLVLFLICFVFLIQGCLIPEKNMFVQFFKTTRLLTAL